MLNPILIAVAAAGALTLLVVSFGSDPKAASDLKTAARIAAISPQVSRLVAQTRTCEVSATSAASAASCASPADTPLADAVAYPLEPLPGIGPVFIGIKAGCASALEPELSSLTTKKVAAQCPRDALTVFVAAANATGTKPFVPPQHWWTPSSSTPEVQAQSPASEDWAEGMATMPALSPVPLYVWARTYSLHTGASGD